MGEVRVGLIELYSQQYLCMCRSFLLPTSTRGVLDKYKDSVRRRREGGRGGREGEEGGRGGREGEEGGRERREGEEGEEGGREDSLA